MLIYIVIFMVFTFLFFEEVFIMMNNKRRHSRRRWLHLSAKKTLITIVLAVIMVAAISIYGIIIVNASNLIRRNHRHSVSIRVLQCSPMTHFGISQILMLQMVRAISSISMQ